MVYDPRGEAQREALVTREQATARIESVGAITTLWDKACCRTIVALYAQLREAQERAEALEEQNAELRDGSEGEAYRIANGLLKERAEAAEREVKRLRDALIGLVEYTLEFSKWVRSAYQWDGIIPGDDFDKFKDVGSQVQAALAGEGGDGK